MTILNLLQVFLGMSIAGTLFHGYCFAFHLLNIVNNNQLLSGVIKAVTLNGKLAACYKTSKVLENAPMHVLFELLL